MIGKSIVAAMEISLLALCLCRGIPLWSAGVGEQDRRDYPAAGRIGCVGPRRISTMEVDERAQ